MRPGRVQEARVWLARGQWGAPRLYDRLGHEDAIFSLSRKVANMGDDKLRSVPVNVRDGVGATEFAGYDGSNFDANSMSS